MARGQKRGRAFAGFDSALCAARARSPSSDDSGHVTEHVLLFQAGKAQHHPLLVGTLFRTLLDQGTQLPPQLQHESIRIQIKLHQMHRRLESNA
mmetsp:Transcript_53156/g.121287  ORF Transcript_53156/g.121287 Transcript_53156/m.121287 type:complete len:94 (-) Transcript_53156:134-415(-)